MIRYKVGMKVRQPEDIWLVEDAYLQAYQEKIEYGRAAARRAKLAIVSICRSAMPHLKNTLRLVDDLALRFRDTAFYVYENDSDDETPAVLYDFALRQWVTVEYGTTGEPDERGFEPDRTHRLARCRTKCQEWVRRNAADADYVLALDTDPHGGFSVDGVINSVGWFCEIRSQATRPRAPGAMASYSLFMRIEEGGRIGVAQYDSWAARLNWWEDRRHHEWFHLLLPPVGSTPIPMNSAFGGACLYAKDAYLAGVYEGGDCEHVAFHRAMQRAGYQLYLNPGSRYIALLP